MAARAELAVATAASTPARIFEILRKRQRMTLPLRPEFAFPVLPDDGRLIPLRDPDAIPCPGVALPCESRLNMDATGDG
jgi:hypothetical protein